MIGINIGAMNTSIAYSDTSNINSKFKSDIILTETSNRTLPSCIGFTKSHRIIGEHALMTVRKHIDSTYLYLDRLMGMKSDSKYSKREIGHCLTDLSLEINEYKELNFILPLREGENNQTSLSSDSLLAAFINKIKNDLIINLHKKECFSFTISVPDFFPLNQRETFSRAFKICDIDNFSIINESSAITLYYGYNKYKDLFLEKPSGGKLDSDKLGINPNILKYVIFIDLGHSKLSLILSEFRPTFFRVANCFTNAFFGGRDMDRLIFNHLCKIFYDKHKIDISSKKKSAYRLMEQITKARKILTGNQETLINIDCLFEDYDFSYLLTRKEFESLIKPMTDSFQSMLEEFYKSSFKSIDKGITAIEMAGECMRTPIFQSIVKEITGKELQKSVIVDEAVSKGCCMYSALLNNALSIQSFSGVYHYNPYTILYDVQDSSKSNVLIKTGESTPINKKVEVYLNELKSNILKICFYYVKEETEFFIDNQNTIGEVNINIEELLLVNKITIKDIPSNKLILNMKIDNACKLQLLNVSIGQDKILTLNIDILCLKTNLNKLSLIRGYFEENELIIKLKTLENDHLKQDENIRNLHLKKNNIESCIYKLKNKYFEKANEYEKLNKQGCIGAEPISLLSRLESVENAIACDVESIGNDQLEAINFKLYEIENLLQPNKEKKSQVEAPNGLKMKNLLNFYTNLIDEEYSKSFFNQNKKLDGKTINLIGEILSKYRILYENSTEDELKIHIENLEKEMKKYFK